MWWFEPLHIVIRLSTAFHKVIDQQGPLLSTSCSWGIFLNLRRQATLFLSSNHDEYCRTIRSSGRLSSMRVTWSVRAWPLTAGSYSEMLTEETGWVGYDVSLSHKNLGPLNQISLFNNSFTVSPRLASSAGLMLVGIKFYWEGSEPSCITAR